MIKIDTKAFARSGNDTIVSGDRLYSVQVCPLRPLDGSRSKARTWEVALQKPRWRYIGCGTASTKAIALSEVEALITRVDALSVEHVLASDLRRCVKGGEAHTAPIVHDVAGQLSVQQSNDGGCKVRRRPIRRPQR